MEIGADLAILMSNVDGIYDQPPGHEAARVIHTFVPEDMNKVRTGDTEGYFKMPMQTLGIRSGSVSS